MKANKFNGIWAAQALLEAGNKLLSDCHKVCQEVATKLNAGQHQVKRSKQDKKKAEGIISKAYNGMAAAVKANKLDDIQAAHA